MTTPRRFPWLLLALLFGCSFVSYMERSNVSVAVELMMPALGLSKSHAGLIFNSFLAGYAIFQIPSGWLGDRLGPRPVLGVSILLWGALTLLSGLLPGAFPATATITLATLCGLRFLLGVAEASTFPVAARAIYQWIPAERRGLGNSLMLLGSSTASALTAPLVSWIMLHHGWRAAFTVTSLFAFFLAVPWLALTPRSSVSAGKNTTVAVTDNSADRPWLSREVLLLSISYISEGYLLFTFISWLYIYLVEKRGFGLFQGGLAAAAPWLAAMGATPLGGWLADRLAARHGRLAAARWIIMAGYFLSGMLLLVAAEANNRFLALAALSASLGALYLAEPSFWSTVSVLAGEKAGVAGGFMNLLGILGGIASNSLIPLLAEHYGWIVAFGSGAVMGCFCATIWWFLRSPGEMVP